MAVAEVDESLKIKSIDVQYDPNQMLMKLKGDQRTTMKTTCPAENGLCARQ